MGRSSDAAKLAAGERFTLYDPIVLMIALAISRKLEATDLIRLHGVEHKTFFEKITKKGSFQRHISTSILVLAVWLCYCADLSCVHPTSTIRGRCYVHLIGLDLGPCLASLGEGLVHFLPDNSEQHGRNTVGEDLGPEATQEKPLYAVGLYDCHCSAKI
eukprot:scaffold248175_cov32-Tisochrysis_lutea.AAC.1